MASNVTDFFTNPGADMLAGRPDEPTSAAEAMERKLTETADKLAAAIKSKEDVEKVVKGLQVDADTDEDDTDYVKYADSLALFVQNRFDSSEAARKDIEEDWLESLKQYKGIYDAEFMTRINPNRSKAFVRVTRTKVKTVDSRLADLLFPANGDKNWDIAPTPLPDMSPRRKEAITQLYEQETGQKITPDTLDTLIQDEAGKQARKMGRVIADQLSELRYREIMRDVIHSGNVYGTGILKGPLVSIKENQQYYKEIKDDGTERWVLKDYDRIIPFAEYVRVWDIYPDMEATSFKDCNYVIQRRKMNKSDLIGLSKRADFSSDVINKYLENNPLGNYEKKDFEVSLQTMGDIISNTANLEGETKKYEVLEYWGYVDASELEQFGVKIPKDKKGLFEVPANIWVLGNKVIKAAISPMDGVKWPYFSYYYDKDETSIFGEGIPSIMRDMQELINAAFRAMFDNAAISAGPQVEVNLDLLSEDEDPRDIHPFKVWLRTGTGADAANPCLRVFELPSYTTEFERMLGMLKEYSDEVTTIPRYMWGDTNNNGAGRTSSGLSMLMGSANMVIKDQVKNFDDGITSPFIKAMYHWNMQFNSDEDIKGDYTIIASGSASLIAKEMYTQYLINFANITNNNMDATIVKRPELIRSIADAFDISSDKFVLSEPEIKAQKEAAAQQASEERDFMYSIIETAREQGVSPEALMNTMRDLLKIQKDSAIAEQKLQQPSNVTSFIHAQQTPRGGAE